jgi:predicted DCC family thiol-disulfide oxidoreductase YuxK
MHEDVDPSLMVYDCPGEGRWTVLYDADCGFCMWLLSALLQWDRAARLHPIALQRSEADDLLQELTSAERMASWHLISPTGERRSGGAAVPPLLRVLAGRLPAAGFARFPRLTDRGYRWVAEHRSQLSKLVPARQTAPTGARPRDTLTSRRRPTTADQWRDAPHGSDPIRQTSISCATAGNPGLAPSMRAAALEQIGSSAAAPRREFCFRAERQPGTRQGLLA